MVINFTVIDGVAIPNTLEDKEAWKEKCNYLDALIASDPEKYKNYGWFDVEEK